MGADARPCFVVLHRVVVTAGGATTARWVDAPLRVSYEPVEGWASAMDALQPDPRYVADAVAALKHPGETGAQGQATQDAVPTRADQTVTVKAMVLRLDESVEGVEFVDAIDIVNGQQCAARKVFIWRSLGLDLLKEDGRSAHPYSLVVRQPHTRNAADDKEDTVAFSPNSGWSFSPEISDTPGVSLTTDESQFTVNDRWIVIVHITAPKVGITHDGQARLRVGLLLGAHEISDGFREVPAIGLRRDGICYNEHESDHLTIPHNFAQTAHPQSDSSWSERWMWVVPWAAVFAAFVFMFLSL